MTICPECKNEYPETDDSCPSCNPSNSSGKQKKSNAKKSKSYYDYDSESITFSFKKILYFVVGIFVVIFLAGVIAGIMTDGENEQQETVAESNVEPSPPPVAKIKPEEIFDHKQLKAWDGNSDRYNTDEDQIMDLFITIAKANLKEDIDLFQAGYSQNFPDLKGKIQKTKEMWGKYDFTKLSHYVAELNINGNMAKAYLIWNITLEESGGEPRQMETTNDVTLQKEAGEWKIVKLD